MSPAPIARILCFLVIVLLQAMPLPAKAECGSATALRAAAVVEWAIETLEAAAQGGDPLAQNELGRRYGLGRGVQRDSARAFSWYEQSAQQGLCDAQTNLGFMFMNGEGVARDLGQAKHWYGLAARQGNARAAYSLGYIAAVFDKDGAEAERWFLEAAEAGYLPAQRSLISLYQMGDLRPRDERAAALWLHRVKDATLLGKVWRKD